MRIPHPRSIARRIKKWFEREPDDFLRKVRGVIHVGANTGQECQEYDELGLNVLWVEPIPSVFEELQENIAPFPKQLALQALITDQDGQELPFHIASNNGASSSILEMHDHKDIWPDITYTDTIHLTSTTLKSLLEDHQIDLSNYGALVMDTQGSELLVLKGAESLLNNFRYIKTEAADFESYASCCQIADLDSYLAKHGFRTYTKVPFAEREEGGTYYDVTYKR